MHTDCSIHTGTSDARCVQMFKRYIYTLHFRHSFAHFTAIRRQGFSKYNTPQTTLICSSSFTVFRRQESSKYKPPQTTPSMLRCFSPLSEVEDCWTTSVAQGSSRQATTTDTIHQPTIEITQWNTAQVGYSATHRTTSFPVRQPTKQHRWLSTNHPLPS